MKYLNKHMFHKRKSDKFAYDGEIDVCHTVTLILHQN